MWSVGLIVAMPVFFFIGSMLTNSIYASITAGDTIFEDIAARPALALSMLTGMAAGIAAFITGLLALVRKKEQAVLVYLSTIIGALLIFFLAAELIFPH